MRQRWVSSADTGNCWPLKHRRSWHDPCPQHSPALGLAHSQRHKDIENRDWPTDFRGRLLVHAGLTMTRAYYDQVVQELDGMGLLPAYDDFQRGSLVGWTHVTD